MEIVDIYNKRKEPLNYTKERRSLELGEYRLSAFIWIINDNDEILIQQRTSSTKKYPNMWGATAGGVDTGESSLDAALREMKEELGIDADKENIEFIGSNKRKRDFIEIYLYKANIKLEDLCLDENEVQAAKWCSIQDFEQMILNGTAVDSAFNCFRLYYDRFYNKCN